MSKSFNNLNTFEPFEEKDSSINSFFIGSIEETLTEPFRDCITKSILSPEKFLSCYIDSPGGDIWTMNTMIDLIEKAKSEGVTVCTVNMSIAASAAGPILASGTPGFRYCYPSARVMVHSASGQMVGSYEDLQVSSKLMEEDMDRLYNLLGRYTKQKSKDWQKLIKETKGDLWYNSQEALKFGFIDHVEIPIFKKVTKIEIIS